MLALAACLPAIAGTSAEGCSLALKSPKLTGRQNSQVIKLFESWWERKPDEFRRYFTTHLKDDGSVMESKLARELLVLDPLPPTYFDIFDKFFTDARKLKRVTLLVNTDAGIFLACSETDEPFHIGPDCSGVPKLHLFLVEMSGLNPRGITHLNSTATVDVDKFSIWTAGSA